MVVTVLNMKTFIPKLFFSLATLLISYCSFTQNYNNIEFIENKGQWEPQVKYRGETQDGYVFITNKGITYLQYNAFDYNRIKDAFHHANSGEQKIITDSFVLRGHVWNVNFVNSSPSMKYTGEKIMEGVTNYIRGSNPAQWGVGCRSYQAVTIQDVYPGIDARYYTNNGTLKYDLIARPGSDVSRIALKYEGANSLSIKNKELVVNTSLGNMRESSPYSYQAGKDERLQVKNKYIIDVNQVVKFDIGSYDKTIPLVIDPTLIFCSLSGSSATNWGFTATYGPDGSFFGGGIVFNDAGRFPANTGAFQTTFQGGITNGNTEQATDMGIIRLTPNGSGRMYATYLGGNGNDQPHSLITDAQGNLYIAGRTSSSNFPGTVTRTSQNWDIVVAKLNATGSSLLGAYRIGGSANDGVNIKTGRSTHQSLEQNYGDDGRSEIILDGAGNAYVSSCTQSADFPVTPNAFQQRLAGAQDAVVLKFNNSLSSLLFSSYLGGSQNDAAYVLALAPNGDIYTGGGTESTDFPGNHAGTVGTSHQGGSIDGFMAQISNNGSTLIRSTFLGTSGIDQVYGVQFDRKGFPYAMGQTTGTWPVINATYRNANSKQFIVKLQPDLSNYVYSTVFGNGSALPNISPTAFLVDRCENVYVSGWGGSIFGTDVTKYPSAGTSGLPTTADALQRTTDNRDFYFFVLQKNATAQLYGSFFGQNNTIDEASDHVDGGTSRFDQNGVIYQSVCANCNNGRFPTTAGAWATIKPATAFCNLGMIKIAFNLSGVGAQVQAAIGGVPNDTLGCVPLTAQFTDLIRNAQQYMWNFGDGTPTQGPLPATTGFTISHTFIDTGTYRIMLISIDSNSCNIRDTAYVNMRVGDIKANLNINAVKLLPCTAYNYMFYNLSTAPARYPYTRSSFSWDFGDGSGAINTGLDSIRHTYAAPGTYRVKLMLHDSAYCNNPDSVFITLRVAANLKAGFNTPRIGCVPYTAVFENTSTGGTEFYWNFGDAASGAADSSILVNPTHVYATPGTYTVRLVAHDTSTCNPYDTAYTTITVYDNPTASFSYTPVSPQVNVPNVFYNASSANAVRFVWYFGDGDSLATISRANITHQYNLTGTYTACLVAFNLAGCADTACLPVDVIINPVLDVPNAFTPNSGDINSRIGAKGYGVIKIKFTIWNRWGQKVFETEDRNGAWDGKFKGVLQPMDVYAYTLEAEMADGKKVIKKGDITLIR